MEIKTKYNIGDEVWISHKSRIHNGIVDFISIDVTKENTMTVYYHIDEANGISCTFEEQQLFPTKEELLKSL